MNQKKEYINTLKYSYIALGIKNSKNHKVFILAFNTFGKGHLQKQNIQQKNVGRFLTQAVG